MSILTQIMISGLAVGSLYALLALGLTLIYQVSGVVNFAQGALATLGAYIMWSLFSGVGLPAWLAGAATLVVTFALGFLLQAALLQPLRRIPAATALVVTLGLLSLIEGAIGKVWGYDPKLLLLPNAFSFVSLGEARVGVQDLMTIGVAVGLIALVFAFLRWTRPGATLRAVAQTPQGARLVGIPIDRVVLIAWGISAATAAAAGVFIAARTFSGLEPPLADIYLLSAFAGAVIGGLDSLPGAAVGALLLGVIQALVIRYVSMEWHDAVVFLLLLAVLLARPAGLFGTAVQRRV